MSILSFSNFIIESSNLIIYGWIIICGILDEPIFYNYENKNVFFSSSHATL